RRAAWMRWPAVAGTAKATRRGGTAGQGWPVARAGRGLDDLGLADARGPQVGGGAAGFGPGAYGLVAGGEEGFGGEHERAPVHGRHPGYADVLAGPYRLGRVDVDRAHEPARQVRADRHERHLQAGVPATDLGEPVAVPGVPGEVDPLADDPAAPQGLAGVGEGPPGPVVGRYEVEPHPVQLRRLPPVQLGHPRESPPPEPSPLRTRYEHRRVPRQPPDGRPVQVVVMVVADHDGVDAGQVVPLHARRGQPGRYPRDA